MRRSVISSYESLSEKDRLTIDKMKDLEKQLSKNGVEHLFVRYNTVVIG
jgi:hypothetical protein